MLCPPQAAHKIFQALAPAFTRPTAARMSGLALIAIITLGRRTLTQILITAAGLLAGHFSTYYRLFSRPAWSSWKVAYLLAALLVDLAPPGEPIVVAGDDTVTEHPGKQVWGKGRHRDAVRSSHTLTKWIWGHKWVVLAIVLPLPYISRPWALPVLTGLYRNPAQSEAEGRRHKTPSEIARILMRRLLTWFPERKFILVGDGGYSSHEMARFARRFRRQLVFVGRFYADARLYDEPPPYAGQGRPRKKGKKRPTPQEVVVGGRLRPTTVDWYGGGTRQVGLVGGEGHWYKAGDGLAAVRWVYVADQQGTHRAEYFFSTDPTLPLEQIVRLYTRRWNLETTFQEVRAHVGLGTTRRWCKNAVQRAEPWLFGLYSVIVLTYLEHLKTNAPRVRCWPWRPKHEPTFSNAIATVRALIWEETVFSTPALSQGVKKLSPPMRRTLVNWLTQAA
jgi:hypothetical protein